MLDLKQELANYPPINIAGLKEKDPTLPDKIISSITLYNQALESIRSNSEDIAIIELKKAIALNPDFYEAMNLLGLCYCFINETEKAEELFKRVLDGEKNSIRALNYIKMIKGDIGTDSISSRAKKRERRSIKEKTRKRESEKGTGKNYRVSLLKYALSFVAGAVLMFILNMAFMQGSNASLPDPDTSSEEIIRQLNEKIKNQERAYNKLSEDYRALEENFEKVSQNLEYYKFSVKLYEIEDLYDKREYEPAADMLILMKTVDFKGEEKERFDKLYEKVMPAAANKVYEEGLVLANTKRQYEEAIKKLNKVQMYKEDFRHMDAVLYYLGKCYQQLNDSRNALATYQKLMEQYPQSSYIKWAKIRIYELTQIP
ncbi:MAG TPA: tetratricopeptide repeat protein [Clostridiaceae bacterium]|nr:tetratricopeptide repeat protein [Clostridiaceae bacterium]